MGPRDHGELLLSKHKLQKKSKTTLAAARFSTELQFNAGFFLNSQTCTSQNSTTGPKETKSQSSGMESLGYSVFPLTRRQKHFHSFCNSFPAEDDLFRGAGRRFFFQSVFFFIVVLEPAASDPAEPPDAGATFPAEPIGTETAKRHSNKQKHSVVSFAFLK